MNATSFHHPHTSVVLAMSADGKIADLNHAPARFGSSTDKQHLEERIAAVDAVIFGAGTLRAYGTTLRVSRPDLLKQRQHQGKSSQPVHIVCSRLAHFDPTLAFFRQPVPRWLLTTVTGAEVWQHTDHFERILAMGTDAIAWKAALLELRALGIERLAVLGGGELVASLLAVDAVDELWLTVCPVILGSKEAPTPVGGWGFPEALAPRLELLSVRSLNHEVFLHYRVRRQNPEMEGVQ